MDARPRRRDAGAASLEWVAALGVASVVVLGVSGAVLANVPGIDGAVRTGICRLLSLGQGDCGDFEIADPRVPTEPCVTSAEGASLDIEVAVLVVRGQDGHSYELAQLSDGRWRVTRMEGGELGVEAGVGGGVALVVNDRTYGGVASADAGASLVLRAGQVWYVGSKGEAERLVNETREDAAEDVVLGGTGPRRWLWEQGQDLVGAITGNGDYEFPSPDEVVAEGGVVLNASAEAQAVPVLGGKAAIGDSTVLGTKVARDGKVTVYLKTTLSGEIEIHGPGVDVPESPIGVPTPPEMVAGGKAAGKVDLITAVTFDSAGTMTSVSATAVASGDSAGVVASLFNGDLDPRLTTNQVNRQRVYQATLPIRSDADRATAANFLVAAGVTQLQLGALAPAQSTATNPSNIASITGFVSAAQQRGTVTSQDFETGSSASGAQASGKLGIQLGAGGTYRTNERTSTGARYWDGTGWVDWTGCR